METGFLFYETEITVEEIDAIEKSVDGKMMIRK